MDKEERDIEGLDEYIKCLNGEYSQGELTEMMEISRDVMQKCKVDWHDLPPIHGLMFIQTLREVKWGDRYNPAPLYQRQNI